MPDQPTAPAKKGSKTAAAGAKVEETTAAKGVVVADQELELYRSLLEPAKEFRNGFTWTAVAGAIFCGLLMMPGSIFLSLMTGNAINASWVTLIIFSEISRRALKTLNTQELVVLLYVAGAMSVGGPIATLIFRQYLVQSDAVREIGLYGKFPSWAVPAPTSGAITGRNLFHHDWLMPILIALMVYVVGRVSSYTLGYFFFRLTSDVEKLPFPFAPINAQGAMALAESGEKTQTWKWRIFSMGAILGIVFGILQVGVPLVTGAILAKPVQIIPLPWYDTTRLTEAFLPATPTGLCIDLGLVLLGMVVPFWAMIGSGAAIVLTMILNPILQHHGILTRWMPGMDTINTSFVNQIDFWMSFAFGVTLAIAIISIYQTIRDVRKSVIESKKLKQKYAGTTARDEGIWSTPAGRGDFSPWVALGIYAACATLIVAVCHQLVPDFSIYWLIFFTFLYTPFISYINARLIGICGQNVDIPYVRESAYILSGYKGVGIWLAPIPVENYGVQAQNFRVTELTGTNFWSYVKADLLVFPLSFALSLLFWGFIWRASAIPSQNFPWAQQIWDLQAKQQVLMFSATLPATGAKPLFFQAIHLPVIASGFGFTMIGFIVMSLLGAPIMAIYGFLQAIGVGMPHMFIPMLIGAFLGKFYFQKRFGQQRFLQMAPVLVAGYGTGIGLIALMGVAFTLIIKAISAAPF